MSFRPNNWATRLIWLERDGGYRLTTYVFIFGSACHLWLLDAAQPDWMPANVVYVLGLLALLFRSYLIGWTLSAVGVAIPIFFLRDQLTQSMYLLFVSTLLSIFEVSRLVEPDAASNEPKRDAAKVLNTVGVMGVMTYGFATLHKINREFFNPLTSCAVYGIDEIETYFNVATTTIDGTLNGFVPFFAIAIESSIVIFYVLGRRRLAWIAAVVFHVPLTLTMAPAFAFVMATGHAALMSADDRATFAGFLKRRWIPLCVGGSAVTAASLLLHGEWPEWTMVPKEFLLWTTLGVLLFAPWRPSLRQKTNVFWIPIVLYGLNGLSPYSGLQYQHAAAMLSNLRVDEGCWNSYVFPESLRLSDEYVRIDDVYFREPGVNGEYEEIVRTQLWSPPQMLQMRRNWCRPATRPLYLSGTFRGEPWEIPDLCDEKLAWPFEHAGVFGIEIFEDYLRFQKNLDRECPQSCIH